MTAKHTPATPLTPMQQFYGTPTPSNAIKLALADSFAYCAPMQPDSEYVKALRKALERSDAYPKLVEALRNAVKLRHLPPQRDNALDNAGALLRELGEE